MTEMTYSQRLNLLHAICKSETLADKQAAAGIDLNDADAQEAATFLAGYITFRAIWQAERSPADERIENFDMLSVYQAFAMLVYAYLTLPLSGEGISPDVELSAVTIAKSLFSELDTEELAEIVESGMSKFQLIGGAGREHWLTYREDLDKLIIAFVVAGTDDDSQFDKDDLLPLMGSMLSMLCEAFGSD